MAGKRVTKVEVERRIAVVYDFLVMGGDTPRLVANISRLFGTSARETARYVAKALERLRSAQQEKLGN